MTTQPDWFSVRPLLIGVVHCAPLPGAPSWQPGASLDALVDAAVRDAQVLAEASLTPAVQAASIADFVSPFANMQPGRSGYVNADITLHLQRPPVGDWHYLRVVSRGAADGVATAQAVLGDRSGAYGACSASSLINI